MQLSFPIYSKKQTIAYNRDGDLTTATLASACIAQRHLFLNVVSVRFCYTARLETLLGTALALLQASLYGAVDDSIGNGKKAIATSTTVILFLRWFLTFQYHYFY